MAKGANKYTGEVAVQIGKRNCILVFDWDAVSALHTQYEADLKGGLLDATKINDPKKLADIMAIGLQRHQPGMTGADVCAASPPLLLMKKQLDSAIAFAYFGPDLMAEVEKGFEKLSKIKIPTAKKKR